MEQKSVRMYKTTLRWPDGIEWNNDSLTGKMIVTIGLVWCDGIAVQPSKGLGLKYLRSACVPVHCLQTATIAIFSQDNPPVKCEQCGRTF